MKVIIPVAGAGAKLRPHTYTQPKPLIPLAGRTILSFIIDQFTEVGINDFVFVIGYLGEKIRNYVMEKYPNIHAEFVVQNERSGTGHAVYLAKEFIHDNEPMCIVYGDTICDFPIQEMLHSPKSVIGVKKVDNPQHFGVAEIDNHAQVKNLIEKPKIPKSNLALVGVYKIVESNILFKTIENNFLIQQPMHEFHLTDVINAMVHNGIEVKTMQVNNWFDCGKKENLLETNAILLNKVGYASEEIPFFDNTIIIHPVSISEGCEIENSIIGPNVTVGEKAIIKNSILKNSIIGSFSVLEKVVLHNSLIGSDALVHGASQSLNIGDNTEIDLSK